LLILLLPERKFLNIIPAVAGISATTFIAWVDVLYIAVETRATTTGFGAFSPFLGQRRELPGSFLLEQDFGGSETTTVRPHALRGSLTRALREECGILNSAEAKGVHCEREGYGKVV
jgi:hypothetical protein